MPELMWRYRTALLYDRTSASCVALAEALEPVSHDRLTRMLQADWSGHTRLESALGTLFVWGRGSLISADTVIPTPFATAIAGRAWGFSRQERRPGSGLCVVVRVWPKGTVRLPLAIRLWRQGGPAKDALALA